jgi:rRNA maturation protein Nop10
MIFLFRSCYDDAIQLERSVVTMVEKCAFCGGDIAYDPYYETVEGKNLPFHAKACADSLKEKKCAYCGGIIAYDPYYETIGGKKLPFHAQACAEALKKKT